MRRHLGYLARVTLSVRARIIHSHFGDVAWTAIGAARATACRHVATFYGYDMSMLPHEYLWQERFRELFASVDCVLCEGPHMASRIVALGCAQEKVRVNHLGVRLEHLAYRPRQWDGRVPLRVLIAATFTEKKGITYAIEALGRVSRELDFVLTIIGDSNGHPEHELEKRRILEAIDRHGLGPRIRMLGYQSHRQMIEEAYQNHVFLAPSVTARVGATEGRGDGNGGHRNAGDREPPVRHPERHPGRKYRLAGRRKGRGRACGLYPQSRVVTL
jgi:colanic acid/amylovoran biosynthesis glycosyltransferase